MFDQSSLSRRSLLATAAGTAAAVSSLSLETPPQTVRAAEAPARKFKKAVKYSMVGEKLPFVELFKLLKGLGYDGIDMDKPANIDEVNEAQKASGLIVHGVVDYVHWSQPLSHPDEKVRTEGIKGLETSIRDSKAYGGTTVLLVPGVVNKDVSYADCYTRSQEAIRKVLPLAKELEIKILFENVWNKFLLSPLETARYIDEFDSPWVGSYFDIGNVVAFGWPEQWIRILGERIGKLDIKEYSTDEANKKGPYAGFVRDLGAGNVNWPEVLTALDEIGFTGWGTAEMPGGDRTRLEQLSQQMDKVLALNS
jgi:L-ribulose-5-phosphate 3-epimerase